MGEEALELISATYRELNRKAHDDPNYGRAARFHGELVQSVIDRAKAGTLLDYGCGKQALRGVVSGVEYRPYDPAIEGLDGDPEPADVVYCGDVMEHVEPGLCDAVLDHIASLTIVASVFVISCHKGTRRLPDGSLAHCNVHSPEWWVKKLSPFGYIERHPQVASKPEVRLVIWK